MYKNQLQEVAQRSCFNLPSYSCVREGPDHAPRFKASVTFNGEVFTSPNYCSTLRHAEHSAAELALSSLSSAHSSLSFANKILDETGVYKNLLQEIAQRVGAPLPVYATFRSGLGHLPVFTGIVELAGISFTGEPAKNKKQAEKNAAMSAWSSLKQLAKEAASSSSEPETNDELEQITIARALLNYRLKEKIAANSSSIPFARKFPMQNPRPTSPQQHHVATSKILPLICQKPAPRNRSASLTAYDSGLPLHQPHHGHEGHFTRPQKFAAAGGPAPYVPIRQFRAPCHRMAPPVTIRSTVPVFSAPPAQIPPRVMMRHSPVRIAPPVCIRQTVPVYSAPVVRKEDPPVIQKEDPPAFVKLDPLIVRKEVLPDVIVSSPAQESASLVRKEVFPDAIVSSPAQESASLVTDDTKNTTVDDKQECEAVQSLEELKI